MAVTTKPVEELSSADERMLRLLRLPQTRQGTSAQAQTAFQKSIVVSALRCIVTYIFLPFVAPWIGLFRDGGPLLGIVISVVAMISITFSMRRFWGSRHPHRWTYAVLGGTMSIFLSFLLVRDILSLF